MRTVSLILVGFLSLICVGCKSFGPSDAQVAGMVDAYKTFAAQERMGNTILVEGSETHPADVRITGIKVTIATPLPPLQVLPPNGDRQYDMIEHIATETARLGMFGAAAYLLKDSIAGEKTTINNNGTTP